MTYVKAGQWRYMYRNADVCDITARTVRKLVWRVKTCWRRSETQNHSKNETLFGGVLHAFLNSRCNNSKVFNGFHESQWKCKTKRNHHECKHVANAKISTRRKQNDHRKWWKRRADFRAVRMFLSARPVSSLVERCALPVFRRNICSDGLHSHFVVYHFFVQKMLLNF